MARLQSTLIDNSPNLMMVDMLKKLISDPECRLIKIATGYWDIPGLALVRTELRTFLEREGAELRLLIGTDPVVRAYQLQNPSVLTPGRFPEDYIKRHISELQVTEEYVESVQLLLDFCKENEDESKLKIHVYRDNDEGDAKFLHAKCYVFSSGDGYDPDYACGIIGSSNFTKRGLEVNEELNHLETDRRLVAYPPSHNEKGHVVWFDEKWNNSRPWNKIFLEEVLRPSEVAAAAVQKREEEEARAQALSPYEVYIKYLQLQFGDMVDTRTSAILQTYLPDGFNSLEYQLDAVKQCFSVMKRYGGFILGDVVGLGKTIVGLLLIRYFLDNAESLGHPRKVLIITPPAIKSNWQTTIREFDRLPGNEIEPCVTFVTTGSVGKLSVYDDEETDDDGGDEIELGDDTYGLILIDESHGFRNSTTQKYQEVNDLIGRLNPTPYVALLSATPQNNSPRDIYNQIRLFQRDANNSNLPGVEGGRLDSFFNEMNHRFMDARNLPQDTAEQRAEARKIIAEVSERIRKCVLNELVVRRTRTDIKKLYGADAVALKFPTVKGPHKLEYHMDDELQQLFFDTTTAICPPAAHEPFDSQRHIGFFRYATIAQFKDKENAKLYEKRNLTVDAITKRLQRIMRILLVKRLESSIAAFKATLENLGRYNDVMIDMLLNDCVYICPDIDVNKIHYESEGNFSAFRARMDELIERKGGNNRKFVAADFADDYLNELLGDRRLIGKLLERWRQNTYDPKFERFKEALKPELFAPDINNPSGLNKPRLVIFTEAIDTLNALARLLKNKGYNVLAVTSKNRDELQETIRRNFDANAPVQDDKYNVIVTTEVLAEGVNLHRSNVILNYDAPWNATRLMQRIGRVNRIGSTEQAVHVFNFFPSEEGNSQIRLVEKAYAKLQSFHEMFGEDSKVFSEREELCEHDLQTMADGEESPFGPYINELRAYRDANPERYAYLSALTPENSGGTMAGAVPDGAVYVFTDNTGGYVSVAVDAAADRAEVISSLATMEALKCEPDAAFDPERQPDADFETAARHAYEQHAAHYITGRDTTRKINDALAKISQIRHIEGLSRDSRRLLKNLESHVRANNTYVVRQVLRFDVANPSLFGSEDDVNLLLNNAFASIALAARQRRGSAKIVLYEIK